MTTEERPLYEIVEKLENAWNAGPSFPLTGRRLIPAKRGPVATPQFKGGER